MKVKIEDIQKVNVFVPYTVTFFIQTPAESAKFHDHVAIKVIETVVGRQPFNGNIYKRGRGEVKGKAEFEIQF